MSTPEPTVPDSSPDSAPTAEMASTPIYKNPYLWGFIIGAACLTAMRPLQNMMQTAPPPIVKLSPWSLTDHDGKVFGSEQLKGKVWVANFVFTTCKATCPALTRALGKVEHSFRDLGDNVRFVTFTVDPATDTPEVLRNYRERNEIVSPRWKFLTGSDKKVREFLVGQLPFHVGEKTPEGVANANLYTIAHAEKLALFDQNGDLREVFSTDPRSLGSLGGAARLLVKKGPNP